MKVGDLVRCIWQPGTSCNWDRGVTPMEHIIKGRFGIIIAMRPTFYSNPNETATPIVLFPQIGYKHPLSESALELINEA
jgi:hypothetical protein|tara:strand:- start:576 stop:812 length:237 start_codon:yes stop_codon:yes gene_type:complete